MSFVEVLIRSILSFIGILFFARIIGKKLISRLTFFDFVAGVTFGSFGGHLIYNKSVPLFVGIIGLTMFSALVIISDYISLKSIMGRKILEGEPQLVIKEGQILLGNMKKSRLTVNELLMLLRKKDVFYIDEVEFAYIETDGTLSIMKKTNNISITREDLKVQSQSRGIPQSCIIDGKIIEENLQKIQKDTQWMIKFLKKANIQLEQVLLVQIDQNDRVFLSLKTNNHL